MLDAFISVICAVSNRERFSTGISFRCVPIVVVSLLGVVRQLFVYACVSIRCIRRKRFQRLVLLCLLYDALSVIVVSVKLINVVFPVETVITMIAMAKHLFVRTPFFSMSCDSIIFDEDKAEEEKYRFYRLFFRHIKHLGPNRFDLDRLTTPGKAKEQSRSLPRIPLPVRVFEVGLDPQ